jgi:hypothetical protein
VARLRKADDLAGAGLAIVDEEKEALRAENKALKMEIAELKQPRKGGRRKLGTRGKPVMSTFATENPMAAGDTAIGMGVMRTGQTWDADAQEDDDDAAEQEGAVTFIAVNPIIKPTAGEGTSGEVTTPRKGRGSRRGKGRRDRTTGSGRRSPEEHVGEGDGDGSMVIDVHDNPMAKTHQRGGTTTPASQRRAERTSGRRDAAARRRAAKEVRADAALTEQAIVSEPETGRANESLARSKLPAEPLPPTSLSSDSDY